MRQLLYLRYQDEFFLGDTRFVRVPEAMSEGGFAYVREDDIADDELIVMCLRGAWYGVINTALGTISDMNYTYNPHLSATEAAKQTVCTRPTNNNRSKAVDIGKEIETGNIASYDKANNLITFATKQSQRKSSSYLQMFRAHNAGYDCRLEPFYDQLPTHVWTADDVGERFFLACDGELGLMIEGLALKLLFDTGSYTDEQLTQIYYKLMHVGGEVIVTNRPVTLSLVKTKVGELLSSHHLSMVYVAIKYMAHLRGVKEQ